MTYERKRKREREKERKRKRLNNNNNTTKFNTFINQLRILYINSTSGKVWEHLIYTIHK